MCEHMGVIPELGMFAADSEAIWFLNGSSLWTGQRVPADSTVHFEIEYLAEEHAPGVRLAALHSTSWRQSGRGNMIVTYVALAQLGPDEYVRDRWPLAFPLTAELLADPFSKPEPHAANEPPLPTRLDVVTHGVRHLKYLFDTDSAMAAAMGATWRRHLEPLKPALAAMFLDDAA